MQFRRRSCQASQTSDQLRGQAKMSRVAHGHRDQCHSHEVASTFTVGTNFFRRNPGRTRRSARRDAARPLTKPRRGMLEAGTCRKTRPTRRELGPRYGEAATTLNLLSKYPSASLLRTLAGVGPTYRSRCETHSERLPEACSPCCRCRVSRLDTRRWPRYHGRSCAKRLAMA